MYVLKHTCEWWLHHTLGQFEVSIATLPSTDNMASISTDISPQFSLLFIIESYVAMYKNQSNVNITSIKLTNEITNLGGSTVPFGHREGGCGWVF